MANLPILTVTLNPALDVTTSVDRLQPQHKLRCSTPRYDAGGGGANVSRAIKRLGGTSCAFVALAGAMGHQYRDILMATGIDSEIWETDGETRFSLTVMEDASGEHFRFVLPGPKLETGQAGKLLAKLAATIASGYRFVVASGSLPPGLPQDYYGKVARLTREAGAAFVIDAAGPALAATFTERPYLVRLNHREAQELIGGDNSEAAAHKLTEDLIGRRVADVVVVTVGEKGALVAADSKRLRIYPPRVQVLSSVGAGDSFVGALVLGLARGWPLEDACRYGVAAATSAVTTPATELCERAATERYFREISGPAEDVDRLLQA